MVPVQVGGVGGRHEGARVGFHSWDLRTCSAFRGDASAASLLLLQHRRPESSDAWEGATRIPPSSHCRAERLQKYRLCKAAEET